MATTTFRVFHRLAVVLVLAALVVSACGSGSPVASPDPTATPAPTEPPTNATAAPSPAATTPASTPSPDASPTPTPIPPARPAPSDVEADGFVTHTLANIETIDDYLGLAKQGVGPQLITKFTITDFYGDADLVWHDSNFFTLHDEWYWFRLLNGREINASLYPPVEGLEFATVQEIYDWANAQPEGSLPVDLQLRSDGRLVITELYSLANADASSERQREAMDKFGIYTRALGFGSLIHYPQAQSPTGDELWLVELEFSDAAPVGDLEIIFELVRSRLPVEIASQIGWVVRSPAQEDIALELERIDHELAGNIIRYTELAVPGEVQVYSGAITAGRVVRVGEGEARGFEDTNQYSIILTNEIPDALPPAAALITGIPQTPLAHVNILARNRGIPNAYLGGLLDDGSLNSLARVLAPAVVYAEGPDQLQIVPITEAQYTAWVDMQTPEPIAVPAVDAGSVPYTIDLTQLSDEIETAEDLGRYRPIIGGKAAGFISLLQPGVVTTPETPMSVTVRAFLEHQAKMDDVLTVMLTDPDFVRSPRARYLLLEGPEDFQARYTDPGDVDFFEDFTADNPPGSVLGDILDAGGFKQYFRAQPIDAGALAVITAQLESTYGHYAVGQGLRFRSSSSVEDIEGFNGAGLYDSNTGFLDAEAQSDSDDRKKTVEWALLKTWASYWGSEAFEERELENVDHRSGAMAVLVHARFDDPLEVSNGVFTFTIQPDSADDRFVMELNVQDGAQSVTNPEPGSGALPEVVLVSATETGSPSIDRVAASTLVARGTEVLSDADLLEIFDQARSVAEAWLAAENAMRSAAQQSSTLVLDFEFRQMAAGWPATVSGPRAEQRIVIKQARTLDPALRGVPNNVSVLPIPDDILARAQRVDRLTCSAAWFTLTTVEVTTDALASPAFGHHEDPFTAQLLVSVTGAAPELGLQAGDRLTLDWRTVETSHLGSGTGAIEVVFEENDLGLVSVELADGQFQLATTEGTLDGSYTCLGEPLLTTPQDYLLSLLPSPGAP